MSADIALAKPQAVMWVSREGKPLFLTEAARRMCDIWNRGFDRHVHARPSPDFRLPVGIPNLLRAARSSGFDVQHSPVRIRHPELAGLAIVLDGGTTLPEASPSAYCMVTLIEAGDPIGSPESTRVLQQLTPSERRVALLVAQGCSNAEIARLLHRSRRTVESQIASIFRRLGMSRRAQLVRQLI